MRCPSWCPTTSPWSRERWRSWRASRWCRFIVVVILLIINTITYWITIIKHFLLLILILLLLLLLLVLIMMLLYSSSSSSSYHYYYYYYHSSTDRWATPSSTYSGPRTPTRSTRPVPSWAPRRRPACSPRRRPAPPCRWPPRIAVQNGTAGARLAPPDCASRRAAPSESPRKPLSASRVRPISLLVRGFWTSEGSTQA